MKLVSANIPILATKINSTHSIKILSQQQNFTAPRS